MHEMNQCVLKLYGERNVASFFLYHGFSESFLILKLKSNHRNNCFFMTKILNSSIKFFNLTDESQTHTF